jgi:C1A family cysteine protease
MKSKLGRKYLCKKDGHDSRDHNFLMTATQIAAMPPSVNLESKCPPVFDQASLGSCTANGIIGAFLCEKIKQCAGKAVDMLSRLFLYFCERAMEGTTDQDAGAQIRDGIKSAAKNGICKELSWPYVIGKYAVQPPPGCYVEARNEQALTYERVAIDTLSIKASLAAGFPVVIGLTLYSSFEAKATMESGIVPMPSLWERMRGPLGGHCMYIIGFDDATQRFLFRNSWGLAYKKGTSGNVEIPYTYVVKYGQDAWKIELVE